MTARPTEKLPSGKDCVLKYLGECGESCLKKKMMMMMMMMMMHSRYSEPRGSFCWFESFRGSCIHFRWVSHHDLRQPGAEIARR